MILGKLTRIYGQLNYLNDIRILKAVQLIDSMNFSTLQDDIYEIEGKNFYYILSSYKTVLNYREKPAESHRKHLDLQYVIYGKEKIGFADYSNIKKVYSEYNSDRDVEFFDTIDNECLIPILQNQYVIFFPGDVHRPGICIDNPSNIRKVVFKILINDR
jgi:YhcH/YjgK/YiaL family protein